MSTDHTAELARLKELKADIAFEGSEESYRDMLLACADWLIAAAEENAGLKSRVATLRLVCSEAYQLAGAVGAPEKALDNLAYAAQGAPDLPHRTFLPISDDDCSVVSELKARIAELEERHEEATDTFDFLKKELEGDGFSYVNLLGAAMATAEKRKDSEVRIAALEAELKSEATAAESRISAVREALEDLLRQSRHYIEHQWVLDARQVELKLRDALALLDAEPQPNPLREAYDRLVKSHDREESTVAELRRKLESVREVLDGPYGLADWISIDMPDATVPCTYSSGAINAIRKVLRRALALLDSAPEPHPDTVRQHSSCCDFHITGDPASCSAECDLFVIDTARAKGEPRCLKL